MRAVLEPGAGRITLGIDLGFESAVDAEAVGRVDVDARRRFGEPEDVCVA